LELVQEKAFAPGTHSRLLLELNLITRLLAHPSIGSRTQGLLAMIETPEELERYLLRAQKAALLVSARGWLSF